jgi:hypothetical protein
MDGAKLGVSAQRFGHLRRRALLRVEQDRFDVVAQAGEKLRAVGNARVDECDLPAAPHRAGRIQARRPSHPHPIV